ncbi:response regulator PleD [compost metagenome]
MFEQSFDQAYALVEQIRQKIALMGHLELEGNSITVSVGLKSFNARLTKEKLFEEVDACLYAAKRTGKNKTVTSLDLVEVY